MVVAKKRSAHTVQRTFDIAGRTSGALMKDQLYVPRAHPQNPGTLPLHSRVCSFRSPRRYTSPAVAITPSVPAASLNSNSQTLLISADGTIAQRIATAVTNVPDTALMRRPDFHAHPNIYRYGRKPTITDNDTSA